MQNHKYNHPDEHRKSRSQPRRPLRSRARVLLGAAVIIAAVITSIAATSNGSAAASLTAATKQVSGPPGPEAVPLEQGTVLAPASSAATGQMVDGIECNAREQVAFHVHTHLSVYVNGQLRPIPPGIGIVSPAAVSTPEGPFYQATQCYYWLHVHAQDGVIHIESPAGHSYTLGQFFDLWGQPLGAGQIGPAKGKVTSYVNGRPYRGNPRNIGLGSHVDIQLDVGTPVVAPRSVNWSVTQL
ncbi:MAG TPA: hypothetical protein VHZ02_08825 [Acidimicrobiales bacterium]|nr:hypothetical protein [Acidimicrobiales bacterium]